MYFTIRGSQRRRAPTVVMLAVLSCSLVACGASPSPKPLSAEAVITSKGSLDASSRPAPAPAGVIAVGRARDYRQWVKLEQASPVMAFLKKKLVEEQGDALLEDWDLTQPVEFIATFDRNFQRTQDKPAPPPKPESEEGEEEGDDAEEATTESPPADKAEDHFFAAFSVPLTRYAPDLLVKLGFKRWTADAYERGKCLVTPALGSAKARLICGDHPDVTHHLYDYLARGLPLEPLSPAPLFVELRTQPLKELWAPARDSWLQSLQPLAETTGPTSRLAQDMMRDVVKEIDAWVASADTVRFTGGPNQRDEFEGSVTLALRAPEPWLVESYLAGAAKVHGAPSAFSNLPKDVGWAWYGYGMPAERSAVLQSALVNLAKTAWQEYGPASALGSGKLNAAEAKSVDRLVSELISAMDSPCVRAEQGVFANLPADPSELSAYTTPKRVQIVKKPEQGPVVPFDVMARATLGQYLLAVPNAASCTQFTQHWVDMLSTAMQALPAKEKKKFPLGISVRKNVKLEGLPPATVTRISLTKQAVLDLMKELKSDSTGKRYYDFKSTDSPLNRWGAPKGPLALSVIVVPSADAAGSDWIGFGLDEKQLTKALVQVTHPVPGETLAARAELAPFIAQNPTSLAFQSFESYGKLMALMGGPEAGAALTAFQSLFHGTTVVTTKSIKLRGNVAEATDSYYLSKEGLTAVRQVLSYDIERLLEFAKQMEQKQPAGEADSKAK
jgi:hypothetical protein